MDEAIDGRTVGLIVARFEDVPAFGSGIADEDEFLLLGARAFDLDARDVVLFHGTGFFVHARQHIVAALGGRRTQRQSNDKGSEYEGKNAEQDISRLIIHGASHSEANSVIHCIAASLRAALSSCFGERGSTRTRRSASPHDPDTDAQRQHGQHH